MFVSASLATGGAERVLADLASSLNGYREIAVVSLTQSDDRHRRKLVAAGVRVVIGSEVGYLALVVRLIAEVWRGITQPTVFVGWTYYGNFVATFLWLGARLFRSNRLVWNIRCSDIESEDYRWYLRMAVSFCGSFSRLPVAIVYNSHAGKDWHERVKRYDPRRSSVISNGVTTEGLWPQSARNIETRDALFSNQPSETILVAQVARNDPMKDWPLFLEATRSLPNVLRIAVGAGTENLPDEDELIRLGRREDVAAILSCVDVLVSSSAFGEGQSNSIAEAMASCCPVVATDVGDARLMLTGGQVSDAGLVVPRRDVKALRKAIQDLCGNEQQRHALGSAGRERIESQYQPNSMMIAFNRLFSS